MNLGEFGIELGESESSPLGGRTGSGQEEKGKSLALQTSRWDSNLTPLSLRQDSKFSSFDLLNSWNF